ncbi:MAG: UDP-galactopyranose mutase [Thermosipho sp. (in: Bacteria)]|nr:UDP-galactopyranose mutase [Thermosipho sp. (in: thermotogales)]
MKNNITIIGSGITGITLAERFASKGSKVLIIEKRNYIGGNCYDFKDENGIIVHKYGPHIFHTNYKDVWNYLSQFTEWIHYQHKVLGVIDGKFVPIPFSLNSLYELIPLKLAERLEEKLINNFGYNKRIPILELRKTEDKDLKFLADFIYEKVFLHYTEKQWGIKPEDIDPLVTARVPIVISRDNRYFQDKYQGIPKDGYTKLFERMLKNKNIEVQLNTDFKEIKDKVKYDLLIYTGPIDEFFDYKYGKLDYRCVKIDFQTLDIENCQPAAVVNYPNDYDFTRTTEFKKFTMAKSKKTIIGTEYPGNNGFKAWPVLNERNKEIFKKYWQEAERLKKENIYFVGRLAEYKYYDMDEAVKNSLDLFKKIAYGKQKNKTR